MIKKILLTILLLSLTGCSQKFGVEEKIPDNLRLKVAEEKITKSEDVNEKKCLKYATSTIKMATGTSIVLKCLEETELNYKKYEYISEEIATNTPYFSNNTNISSAEYLPKRKDGKQPIAFYSPNSDKKWFKDDNNKIYRIKKATTTLEAFEMQTKSTFLQSFLNIFVNKTIAATSYTSNSTYTPDCDGTVEVLVIGGGGGGGGQGNTGLCSGGGGAGEYVYDSSHTVTKKSYNVVVGDGGNGGIAAGTAAEQQGSNGDSSTFDTITAYGGGGGGGSQSPSTYSSGKNGGSGGGSAYDGGVNSTPGTGVSGNTNGGTSSVHNGGNGTSGVFANSATGGGGGAGSAGTNGNSSNGTGGNGGSGLSNDITGSSVERAGGGGGGGGTTAGTASGGGGAGSTNGNGNAGTDGTGGGGGGAGTTAKNGGNGGSGIVIISFNEICAIAGIDEAYVISHR